jgi:hypothetical protein
MNLVTPKDGTKHEFLFDKLAPGGLLNIQVRLKLQKKSKPDSLRLIIVNLVTPKAAAKHELLFNKPAFKAEVSFFEHPSQI